MKNLSAVVLVSLVATVISQSGDPEQCINNFFEAPENLPAVIAIGQECADELDLDDVRYSH